MITRLFGELKKILSLRSLQARIFLIVLAAGLVPSVIMVIVAFFKPKGLFARKEA